MPEMTKSLPKTTVPEATREAVCACEALAARLPEPRDLFAGVGGGLRVLPENPLQFHRHGDRHLRMGAPFLHHRFVLVVCLREPGGIVLDGRVVPVAPGQGLLIFPHQHHYYTRMAHPDRVSWLFTTFEYAAPDMLASLRNTPVALAAEDLHRLQQVTQSFLDARRNGPRTTRDMPLELALLLSGLLARARVQHGPLAAGVLPDGPQARFLHPLFAYIDQHVDGPLDLARLAKCVHLSPSRMRARFKHILGIGPGTFVRHTRIHRACGMLNSTDLNVTQIAEQCGFHSVYAFSRAFRQLVGVPPTAFRERMGMGSART